MSTSPWHIKPLAHVGVNARPAGFRITTPGSPNYGMRVWSVAEKGNHPCGGVPGYDRAIYQLERTAAAGKLTAIQVAFYRNKFVPTESYRYQGIYVDFRASIIAEQERRKREGLDRLRSRQDNSATAQYVVDGKDGIGTLPNQSPDLAISAEECDEYEIWIDGKWVGYAPGYPTPPTSIETPLMPRGVLPGGSPVIEAAASTDEEDPEILQAATTLLGMAEEKRKEQAIQQANRRPAPGTKRKLDLQTDNESLGPALKKAKNVSEPASKREEKEKIREDACKKGSNKRRSKGEPPAVKTGGAVLLQEIKTWARIMTDGENGAWRKIPRPGFVFSTAKLDADTELLHPSKAFKASVKFEPNKDDPSDLSDIEQRLARLCVLSYGQYECAKRTAFTAWIMNMAAPADKKQSKRWSVSQVQQVLSLDVNKATCLFKNWANWGWCVSNDKPSEDTCARLFWQLVGQKEVDRCKALLETHWSLHRGEKHSRRVESELITPQWD